MTPIACASCGKEEVRYSHLHESPHDCIHWLKKELAAAVLVATSAVEAQEEALRRAEHSEAQLEELKADAARLDWLAEDDNLQAIRLRWVWLKPPYDIRGSVDAVRKETGR